MPDVDEPLGAQRAEKRRESGFSPASAAVGAGGVGGALAVAAPTPRSPMTNRGRGVKRKLERKASRLGGNTKLKSSEFAEISGGRGWRPQNNPYTARMALSMKKGKVKQNRLVLDVYDDNVVQRDGAHRAHAAAMLDRKIKVKAVRHKGEKAPKHMTGINALRDEIVQGRHRSRLKKLGRSGGLKTSELQSMSSKLRDTPAQRLVARSSSKASASGVPKFAGKYVSPVGAAAGAGVLAASGYAAHRINQRSVAKGISSSAGKAWNYPILTGSMGDKAGAVTAGAAATWAAKKAITSAITRRAEKKALQRSAKQTKQLIRHERKVLIPAAVGSGVLAGTAAGAGAGTAAGRRKKD